ncbi:tail protein X [Cupriavidus metallidurans]|jgi:phage tail protein X|uniref:Phage tail protein n=1 Tax=Cupriavidus metallidurans TaxID=119219 RepID=A0A482IPH1_9BURK|nr:tail protein X [Cupriavidus metallidurans]QBP10101.1 phage tail protein [Cupriavidus metallidurans]QWC87176.1 tail protein X [Cupriavidus metallidurans]
MRVITMQGDTVDAICHRVYGQTAGITEAVLEANQGLADLGPVLPHGTLVDVPDLPQQPKVRRIQLWD